MQEEVDPTAAPAIACALSDADLRDRQSAWLKLHRYVLGWEPVPGGLDLTFSAAPGLRDSLAELVGLEAKCCAWMAFRMADSPVTVRLSITGTGTTGERDVREAFDPFKMVE